MHIGMSHKTCLLAFSYQSACPSCLHVSAGPPLDTCSWNLIFKIYKNPNLVKMGQKYQALCLKTYVLLLPGTLNCPNSSLFWVKWYQAAGIAEDILTLHNVFSSTAVLKRTHCDISMAMYCIVYSDICRYTVQRKHWVSIMTVFGSITILRT
jgi:hypothetical protein